MTSIDGDHYLVRILPTGPAANRIGVAVLTFVDVTALHRADSAWGLGRAASRASAANKDFAVISTGADGRA